MPLSDAYTVGCSCRTSGDGAKRAFTAWDARTPPGSLPLGSQKTRERRVELAWNRDLRLDTGRNADGSYCGIQEGNPT